MATVGTYIGLADVLKSKDPDGKIAKVVEQVAKLNPVLEDAISVEGNLTHGHQTTIRTGISAGTWRRFYEGVQPSKSAKKQVTDTCGNLEDYINIDKGLADMSTDKGTFMMSEAKGTMEGMSQTMATTLFYGNTEGDPEKFLGLAPRFDSLSAENGSQIVDAGGTQSDNTSLWFVTWDQETCHLIHPKGSKVGMDFRDLGEATQVNSDGSMYQVYRSHFKWTTGLSVRDWRYISRVANIDVSNLATFNTGSDTSAKLLDLLIDAESKLFSRNMGKTVIYCNRTVYAALNKMAANKGNLALGMAEYNGKKIPEFWGMPIKVCDAILNTEARIT